MKRALFPVIFLALGSVALAQSQFSERLTAEERQRAGLDQLTPAQLGALNALVKRDHDQGEKVGREKLRAEVRKEVRKEVSEEVRKEAKVEARKEEEERRTAEVRILSRIQGSFSGWSGNTIFKLENGQVWRQAETGDYYTKPTDSPAVLLEKVFGGWRLYDQNGGWVKVVRIM